MSVDFTLAAKTRVDKFTAILSIGDVVKFNIDVTAWQEDNDTVTSATWTNVFGTVGITGQQISSGVVSANLSATQSGTAQVSVLLATASGLTKKIWINMRIKDQDVSGDDYGFIS